MTIDAAITALSLDKATLFAKLQVDSAKEIDMAIASLKAWEEIIIELEDASATFGYTDNEDKESGVDYAIMVIKEHVQEIEK